MKITRTLGEAGEATKAKKRDYLEVEWDELGKRILRKQSESGVDVALMLDEGETLEPGHKIYEDDEREIVVRTPLEPVYVIQPAGIQEMGTVAFELGNRHTPCLIEGREIIVRRDHTLESIFTETGVAYHEDKRRLGRAFRYKGHTHAH